mgnify:CR=1 FL=1
MHSIDKNFKYKDERGNSYGIKRNLSISSSIKFVLIIRAKHCISRANSIYCNWKGERS